jgi:L-iditol 2-dehydrogenase
MKALVLKEYGRLSYEDVPEPEAGPEDVVVAVKACGICGSDVHGMDGSSGRRLPPIIMGHEAAGVIAATGERVEGWQAGDRVTFDSTVFCGECWYCRRGEPNLCDRRRVLGVSCEEYRWHGAFAERVAVPTRILYRVPEDVSFVHASFVEPLSVARHALSLHPPALGDQVVVIGAGIIGLLLIQLLRATGCGRIIAVDLDASRLELARRLGATEALPAPGADVPAEVRALTGGRGADVAFDAVGLAATVSTAAQCLRKGGALTLIGNLAPSADLPLQAVVTRQLSLFGSCASAGEYPACLDLMARGVVDVDPLISAVAPLSEGNAWFQRLYAGEAGLIKVVLQP